MTDKSLATAPVLLDRPILLTPPVRPAVTSERQVPLNGAVANGNSRSSVNSLNSLKRLSPEEVAARKADKKKANFKKTNNKKAKPLSQVDVETLNAEIAAANRLAKKLRGEITPVSCVCTGKVTYGAFYRVTTPGETFGLTGLWHVSDMPGGATELAALAVDAENTENNETTMELDIIGARVENSGRSPIVKLSFNLPF
ncbi:MAG: hypothetical protein Q8T09_02085 [Candidatus Melainabacteria bacterium]|nr:hypothetical protein [Candidatus Melainabacteria bacterium]